MYEPIKKYEHLCKEHTLDKIKEYDYTKLQEINSEFIASVNKLLISKKTCLHIIMLFAVLLTLPLIFKFYNMIYAPIKRAGVVKYNIGKETIIICIILFVLILIYNILADRINCVIIELDHRQKDIDFYLFLQEIQSLDDVVNSRMLLFDKDDRINSYFDSNHKRTINLFVLGVILLITGILLIFAVFILTLDANVDNVKIISGFVTGVFTNFIGVIFIGMYNKTLESTLTISNLINENRKTNFSAYIVSKISDEKIRNEALSRLAVSFFDNGENKESSSK